MLRNSPTSYSARTTSSSMVGATLRVARITNRFKSSPPTDVVVHLMWPVLDLCAAAEHRAHVIHDHDSIPAALAIVDFDRFTDGPRADTSILGPLAARYPALVRSLHAFRMDRNAYDESADLAAFATLATQLRELTLQDCGITSLQGLEGRCEYLQMLKIDHCKGFCSLAGLEFHACLISVSATSTRITSLLPLLSCRALTTVSVAGCNALASLEGLEHHPLLEVVDAAYTPITSTKPLLTCPALTSVTLLYCRHLLSLEGLENHAHLRKIRAALSAVQSIEALLTCPALTKVLVGACRGLASLRGLEHHQCLEEVNASDTPITSVEPLFTCPVLRKVVVTRCPQLPVDFEWPIASCSLTR